MKLKCLTKDPSYVEYTARVESLWGSGAYTLASSHPGLVRFIGPLACLLLAISILHAGCMLINRLAPNPSSGMQIKKIPPFSALVFWPAQVVSRMKKEGLS